MGKGLEQIDPRVIYASLLIIMVFSLVIHLSTDKMQSLVGLFMIIIIALGNIGYLYRKFGKAV